MSWIVCWSEYWLACWVGCVCMAASERVVWVQGCELNCTGGGSAAQGGVLEGLDFAHGWGCVGILQLYSS